MKPMLIILFATSLAVRGEDLGKYRAIIDRAPFRNTMVPHAAAPTGGSQLRFTGMARIGNRQLVGIEDVTQQRSWLLAVGERQDGIEIQIHAVDEAGQTVTLTHNGKTETLILEKTPASGGPAAPTEMAGATPPPPARSPPHPVVREQPGNTNSLSSTKPPIVRRKRLIMPRTQ